MALSENEEVKLIEKADLRFVLASSEEAFERNLDIFFPAVLLKLASQHASVRQMVFQVVKNVMGRIGALKSVKLPTGKLIAQAKAKSCDSPAVGQYSLLFASRGVERMSEKEKQELVPEVIEGFSLVPESLKPRMFNVLCKLLLSWKTPLKASSEEQVILEKLDVGLMDDKLFLLEKFTSFFFLSPLKADPQANVIPRGYSCPGLSVSEVEFFTYNAGVSFNKEQLLAYKEAIFRLVISGFLPEDMLVKFFTVVSTDTSDLSNQATGLLKKVHIPYEDVKFIDSVVGLYIGDSNLGRPPVIPVLQEKLLSLMTSSVIATKDFKTVSVILSIGLNSSFFKLRSAALHFIQHVARYNHAALASQDDLSDFSTNIASLIRNNLHSEGWPRFQLNSSVPNFALSLEQRRKQYETLGIILKQDEYYVQDLSFVRFLLDSMRGDLSIFRATIQDALNSLTPLMKSLSAELKVKLKNIATKTLNDNYDMYHGTGDDKEALMFCRVVMIKFINSAFPFEDAEARYLNVMGTWKENRFDLKEESLKGLHPYWYRVTQSYDAQLTRPKYKIENDEIEEVMFPDTQELIRLFNVNLENLDNRDLDTFSQTLDQAVRFIFRNAVSQATLKRKGTSIVQDEHWLQRVDNSLKIDDNIRSMVKKEILGVSEELMLKFLTTLIEELIKGNFAYNEPQINSDEISLSTLVVVFAECTQGAVIQQLQSSLKNLHSALGKHQFLPEHDAGCIAKLYGIIFSNTATENDTVELLNSIEIPIESADFLAVIHSASHSIPLTFLNGRSVNRSQLMNYGEKLTMAAGLPQTQLVAMKGLAQLLKYGLLEQLDIESKSQILKELTTLFKKNMLKSRDSMILWALLSMYSTDSTTAEVYFDALQETHVSKEINLQFFTGEAISIVAGGWRSKVLVYENFLNDDIISGLASQFDGRFSASILPKLLKCCEATKPSLRKAACIWLLCFVKYLGDTNLVRTNAEDIHLCFVRFLGESDDIIQDSASRGLGLIFDSCDKEGQDNMLKGLLKSFIDPKATTGVTPGTITSETQLFEPGTMNTNEGSLTTYKDILSLASEAGDPSMVYKFMPLARNSALWSSRKGMAFGLTSMFSKTSLSDLFTSNRTFAEKLVPLLYRYRFDPYRNVADAMNGIWQTLIKNTAETVAQFYEPILHETLKGMGAKDWRVREASVYALTDLLSSSGETLYHKNLETVWTMTFRVMDDIKESVRSAGLKLAKKLSSSLVRSAANNSGQSSDMQEILTMLIPLFLGPKGLNSDADEVKSFALETLINLVKESKKALEKFAPSLIYEFLMLLSPLEPQAINYLTMNADKYNISAVAVDMQRATTIQSSPMMNCVEGLLGLCTGDLLSAAVESVILASKKGIGLPSKIGATTAIELVVGMNPNDLRPFGAKLLKACFLGLNDRNRTVREAYATSLGRVCKLCTPARVSKYGGKLVDKFMSADNETDQIIVGLAIESIHKYSPVMFESVASAFLPFIFVAKHSEDNVSEVFTRVWDEATSSGTGTVRLHLAEIVSLASANLGSPDFNVRLMCGKSVCDVCTYATPNAPVKIIEQLCTALLEASNGRSWQGKEVVIESLVSLAAKFESILLRSEEQTAALETRLVTELTRDNSEYVRKVLLVVLPLVTKFPGTKLLDKILEVAQKVITDIDNNGLDAASEAGSSDVNHKKQRLTSSVTRKSQRDNVLSEEYKITLLKGCATMLEACISAKRSNVLLELIAASTIGLFESQTIVNTWRSQIAVSEIGYLIATREGDAKNDEITDFLKKLWRKSFEEAFREEAIENVKIQCVKFGKVLLQKKVTFNFVVVSNLQELLRSDPTPQVITALHNAGIV
ncbi:LAME_0H16952g1_1 [Lachancea meyersii CBS 8951]|uniref:LAME_0H16952g1_1 n=1 Tax=Lachancea meyersii CBS 8951 TaxID=1266667 RepID=A0A1G4KI70_9SACH|nr:LAME_0H16952g1_1 [Lachancea meyersii CBS 8951]